MVTWDRNGDALLLAVSPDGVRFLREQWLWLRDLVRWQLARCSPDPLAALVGLPVSVGAIDGRLAYVVDYWCGTDDPPAVRRVREGWVLHDIEIGLGRVLAALPRHGGVVEMPSRVGGTRSDGVVVEWGWMIETLHVVLDVSGRISDQWEPSSSESSPSRTLSARTPQRDSERLLPPPPAAEEIEVYQRSLQWLEAVLDALAQAERAAQAPAD
ncbi:MAG: hypothetical protein M3R63_03700 [Actinomycetota bacterium]|nr:hypothetical protein [Actinomycetota bacterium]